jgi:hypothetical protein
VDAPTEPIANIEGIATPAVLVVAVAVAVVAATLPRPTQPHVHDTTTHASVDDVSAGQHSTNRTCS